MEGYCKFEGAEKKIILTLLPRNNHVLRICHFIFIFFLFLFFHLESVLKVLNKCRRGSREYYVILEDQVFQEVLKGGRESFIGVY